MIQLYSCHSKEWTVCQKTVYICPLGRLTRWNWTIFLRNAHTCSSLNRICVVRQQRARRNTQMHFTSRRAPMTFERQMASMLHKHPFLSLMASSPYLRTFHWMCLYISLCVCPVNTLMHTHRFVCLLFICLYWKEASGWSPWKHSREGTEESLK